MVWTEGPAMTKAELIEQANKEADEMWMFWIAAINLKRPDPLSKESKQYFKKLARLAILKWHDAGAASQRETDAKLIPTNWTDPLLSGPNAVVKIPAGCPDIERLLLGIAQAIRAQEGG